jgi:O-antigen/teichoic acid export membrane protein
MALCASTAIAGWSWFYDPLLRREFEFGRRFASLVTSAVCFAVVGIGTAVAGLGVWSLVLAQLANVLTLSLMQVILAPLRVRPCFDRAAARAALQSGRGFLTQTVAGFFSQNAASIVVAKVLGATQLGLFSRIYYLAELPYKAIAEPVAQVTFPAFARMRARGEQVERPFLSAMRLVALVSCPLGVILSAAAAPVVQVVYGDQWLAIIGPLGLLGIWATIRPVQLTIGWLLNSTGHAGVMGRIALGMLCVSVPALVLACHLDGLRGAVIVLLATQAFGGSVQAGLAHRRVGVPVRRQFAAVAPILLACGAMWVVTRVVSDASSQMAAPATLALAAGAGLIAYLAVIATTAPDVLKTTAGQLGRILRRTPRSAPAGA